MRDIMAHRAAELFPSLDSHLPVAQAENQNMNPHTADTAHKKDNDSPKGLIQPRKGHKANSFEGHSAGSAFSFPISALLAGLCPL